MSDYLWIAAGVLVWLLAGMVASGVWGAEIVVVPVGTPGCRPMGIVDRDAYDQTDALARHTDISSDPLRAA